MILVKKNFTFLAFLFLVLVLGSICDSSVFAGTAEAEKEDEAISTPYSYSNNSEDALVSSEKTTSGEESQDPTVLENERQSKESDEVGFNYFLTSGYAANDIQNIPTVGHVTGTTEIDGSLSTAKTVYVSVSDEKIKLDPGVKLIVFGDGGPLVVRAAHFQKRFIKNLGILRIREQSGKQRYLADVINSYDFISAGSPVKFYDSEKSLWDKAQVAKQPADHAVRCYVAGGERGRDAWNQTDYIILTSGTKQGVVEGMSFRLFEISYDRDNQKVRKERGWAKVFYSGATYSLAKIQTDSDSIERGFEAVYKP